MVLVRHVDVAAAQLAAEKFKDVGHDADVRVICNHVLQIHMLSAGNML